MMNAIDYMIRIEEDGLNLYEILSDGARDRELKEIFELLAERQRSHLSALETLRESVGPDDAESGLLERATHVENGFRRLLNSHDMLHELKNDHDAFVHVLKAEEDTIKLLEGMAKAETRITTRTLLERIAEDEKAHLTNIENIYEFIEAPRTYLEWGEFSNLHPL
jgi:rubrerythrin